MLALRYTGKIGSGFMYADEHEQQASRATCF